MLKVKVEPVDPSLRAEVKIKPDAEEEEEEEPTENITSYHELDVGDQKSEENVGSRTDPPPEENVTSEPPGEEVQVDHEDAAPQQETIVVQEQVERAAEMVAAQESVAVMPADEKEGSSKGEKLMEIEQELDQQEDVGGREKVTEVKSVVEQEVVMEEHIIDSTQEVMTETVPQVIIQEEVGEQMEVGYVTEENAEETVYVFEEGVEYVVEEEAGEEYIMEGEAKLGDGAPGEHIVAIINEGEEGEQRVLLQRQEDGNHVIVESLPYDAPIISNYQQFNVPSSSRSSPRQVIGGDGMTIQENVEISTEEPEEVNASVPKKKRKKSEPKSPKEKKKKVKKKKVPTATLR